MTDTSWTCKLVVTLLVAVLGAQVPLPDALKETRFAYLTSQGVERKWLDKVAKELRKDGRFTVVSNRDSADVVMTLTTGQSGDGYLGPAGNITVLIEADDPFRLVVQSASSDEVLWDDSRKVYWMKGGAVADIVKDLLKRLETAEDN
jgi:hypothetical protein